MGRIVSPNTFNAISFQIKAEALFIFRTPPCKIKYLLMLFEMIDGSDEVIVNVCPSLTLEAS